MNTRHRHAAGGFAGATAFGLRRLVAAFVLERKPSGLGFGGAASKSASKLAHSKRWRAPGNARVQSLAFWLNPTLNTNPRGEDARRAGEGYLACPKMLARLCSA